MFELEVRVFEDRNDCARCGAVKWAIEAVSDFEAKTSFCGCIGFEDQLKLKFVDDVAESTYWLETRSLIIWREKNGTINLHIQDLSDVTFTAMDWAIISFAIRLLSLKENCLGVIDELKNEFRISCMLIDSHVA